MKILYYFYIIASIISGSVFITEIIRENTNHDIVLGSVAFFRCLFCNIGAYAL